MSRTGRFTLIDLLFAIGTIALLVPVLLPILDRPRVSGPHIYCGANLKGITQSLSIYVSDNDEQMPGLRPAADYTARPVPAADRAALEEQGDCVVQAWWLLVEQQIVQEDAFGCPSDDTYVPPDPSRTTVGFSNEMNVSYGLQPTTRDESINVAWPGAEGQKLSEMIVAGDRPAVGVGGGFRLDRYSPNHDGEETNVATALGTVNWVSGAAGEAKNQIGWGGNNIFAADLDEEGERTRNGTRLVHPSDTLLYTTRSD
jgi:hypothetical protein